MGILHHIDAEDVPADEAFLMDDGRHPSPAGLVKEYDFSMNDDNTAALRVTTWTRNLRRARADQRGDIVGQHDVVTFTGYELAKLVGDLASTLLHLEPYKKDQN